MILAGTKEPVPNGGALANELLGIKNTRNIAIEKSDLINPKYNPNIQLVILPNSNEDEIYLKKIAKKYNLKIIQDTCHGIDSRYKKKHLIHFGDVCTYSMHPLKNLNIWGDGGFVATNNKKLADKLYLLRNHGLINRNNSKIFAYNSRLDTIQAVVANYKLKNKLNNITKKRIKNALLFDKVFRNSPNVKTVKRFRHLKEVYHLYHINVKKRDQLQQYLIKNGVDAKVHYPIPIHLQPAAKYLKYKRGDFPIAEKMANTTMSLPVHEFIKEKDIKYVANLINNFYNLKKN